MTSGSDIYALGLVLYELFTGKRPHEAKTIAQMLELQEAAQLTSMTSVAADIDPAVEKAIRRCLDPDAGKRPATALTVAAAGETEGLALRYSIPGLVFIVACLFGSMVWRNRGDALMHTALDLPPEALAAKAREIATALGYPRRPADSTLSLDGRGPYINYLNGLPEPRKWDEWLAAGAPHRRRLPRKPHPVGRPARRYSHARQSRPYPARHGLPAARRRARVAAGGLSRRGSGPGRLCGDHAKELPTGPADQVRAWKGPHPKIPKTELTLEIASWRDRITRARVAPPWAKPNPTPPLQASLAGRLRSIYGDALTVIVLLLAILFARRNWKLGRVDRKGALRAAAARFLLALLAWIGLVHAVADDAMVGLFTNAIADWLMAAAVIWLLYLALEPAVRARWPHSIVTWNRLLAGRWRDPQVASHS